MTQTFSPLSLAPLISLPDVSGKTVLDLGAGAGQMTAEFAKTARGVVSVDPMPHLIEQNRQANRSFSTITYLVAKPMELSFKEETFDLISLSSLLLFLRDEEATLLLERANQWLKPGGHLFIQEPYAPKVDEKKEGAVYRTLKSYEALLKKTSLATLESGSKQMFLYWLFQK